VSQTYVYRTNSKCTTYMTQINCCLQL